MTAPTPTRGLGYAPFALDARSLGAFRIVLGIWLLLDLLVRSIDLTAHYTDDGVLPRFAWRDFYTPTAASDYHYWLSLHMLRGDAGFIRVLFLLAAVAYALFTVGYRTRTVAVVAYILDCSLQARNPLINDGSDNLTRVLLFWALFLPLGARFSFDARRLNVADRVNTLAGAAYVVQLGLVYFCGAVAKSDPVWTRDGTALYYALSIDAFATPLGRALANVPAITKPLTFAALALEWLGPFLVLLPWARVRIGVVLAFWSFHAGTALMLHLGLFPLAGCLAWLPLLPASVWEGRPARYLPITVGTVPARLSLASRIVVGVLLAYVVVWNVRELFPKDGTRLLPLETNIVARLIRLDQTWELFAPKPMLEDGWYVMEGTLADGTKVNLWDDTEPLPWAKPESPAATFENTRWRKYLLNIYRADHERHRNFFTIWLALRWEANHKRLPQLLKVELVYQLEMTVPPGEVQPPPVRQITWTQELGK